MYDRGVGGRDMGRVPEKGVSRKQDNEKYIHSGEVL